MNIRDRLKSKKVRLWLCLAILVIIMFNGFALRSQKIQASLPYVASLDEGYLLEPAKNIILNSDFNPHVFTYPSLPIYLASLGIVGGYFKEAPHLPDEAQNLNVIGQVVYPFYESPQIIGFAKKMIGFLSVLAFFFIGLASYKAFKIPALLFLPALFLSMSAFYLFKSWVYINVDIIATVFVAFFYACLFSNMDKDTYMKRAIIPGVAAGLVIASKYNMFPIILVTPLALFLFNGNEKYIKAMVSVIAAVFSFLLVSPYILLDISHFVSHAAGQIYHYQTGHTGHEVIPGVSHTLKYLSAIIKDYGWISIVLSILGLVFTCRKSWRHSLVFLAFPLLLLAFMSTQKVFFARNVLPLYLLWSVFIAAGFVYLYEIQKKLCQFLLNRYSGEWTRKWTREWIPAAFSVTLLVITVALMPVQQLFDNSLPVDSRNEAAKWINQNIPQGSRIILGSSIRFDERTLFDHYQIKTVDFRKNGLKIALNNGKGTYVVVPEFKARSNKKNIQISAMINKTVKKVFANAQSMRSFGTVPLWLSGESRTHWYSGLVYVPATPQARFTIYKL